MFRMMGELAIGFDKLSRVQQKLVTIYGSARTPITDKYYALAENLGGLLVHSGFGVMTGGGPGIMEAANKGAYEAKGVSIGVNISLPKEQIPNRYQTMSFEHEHFYTRKLVLAKYSVGFAVFPGGFGTLDEMLEVLTLVQTQKLKPFPIFLISSSYWSGLVDWMKSVLIPNGAIAADDLNLFKVVDNIEEIPEKIIRYHGPTTDTAEFKVPTLEDRRKALGYLD